jgi:hypothetical protein
MYLNSIDIACSESIGRISMIQYAQMLIIVILFAIMHQIVEKELPVQAKPAKVNNNSKRPCKHVYFLLCNSCFCCTSFVLDIDNTNIIKNVLLAEMK